MVMEVMLCVHRRGERGGALERVGVELDLGPQALIPALAGAGSRYSLEDLSEPFVVRLCILRQKTSMVWSSVLGGTWRG